MARVKEENYFDMFIESAEFACSASAKLLDMVVNYEAMTEEKAGEMHEIEHNADQHFHKIYQQLNRSFTTPIEREDILAIAKSIDDIVDLIEDIAYKFYVFDIKIMRQEASTHIELIVKACDSLKIAISEFKNFRKSKVLSEKIIEINTIEEEGDRLYRSDVHKLFTEEKDTLEIVRWREVYKHMEDCLDACEDVADVLEGVVIKNS